MKKLILFLIIPFLGLLITSCGDDDPITQALEGNLYITSIPSGAEIWIDGVNTSQTTPDTVKDIEEGVRNVTLKRDEFLDTTFSVSITADETSIIGPVVLSSDIDTELYNPVRIYESYGTTALQPSGLDLSSGNAWGISSDSSGVVDIYYYSNAQGTSYLIQSADLAGLIRETDFFVGSGTSIFDGEDSPLHDPGTWATNIDESENNYVYLYDHDGHYSKLLIVNRGGGSGPGDPAYVDVQWHYNKTPQDNRFK
jgi:hypothetical protein